MNFVGEPKPWPLRDLKHHPTFRTLASYSKEREKGISQNIAEIGFDRSEPIIMGIFGDERFLVDGYQRIGGATTAGLEQVWIQEIAFESIEEAIAYVRSRYRLRRKGGDGDILFELCRQQEKLVQHGGKRRGEVFDDFKSQAPNLITGVTTAMCESMSRVTSKKIAAYCGVPKHRVDHVRSKYFRRLLDGTIERIRLNELDACELVANWAVEKIGPLIKPELTEPPAIEEEVAALESVDEADHDFDILEFLDLSKNQQDQVIELAIAEGTTVEELLTRMLIEKIDLSQAKPSDAGSTDENMTKEKHD